MSGATSGGWNGLSAAELERLAQEHGTPYFVYDADEVARRIRLVRDAFGGLLGVYYAVKANPNLALLRALDGVADGLDISSAGELQQILLAGWSAEPVSFAGPAKTRDELKSAVQAGVGCISVESLRELDDCVSVARELGRPANVTLRINPKQLNKRYGLKMGGRPTQFGIDEECIDEALRAVVAQGAALNFRGLHVYAGSQCFDADGVFDEVSNTLRLVSEAERAVPELYCAKINLGGGFGAALAPGGKELDVAAMSALLRPQLREFVAASPRPRQIFFELGRFLTSTAGIYVARVVSGKTSRGKQFFVTDGGLHHHLTAAGTFGAAMRGNFPMFNVTRPQAPLVTCSIAGPSCNPTDLLGIDVELAEPQFGDLIAVQGSGSYSLTASPILFLGRRTAAEWVKHGSAVTLGRRPRDVVEFN